jgi:CrcB protein
MSINLFLLVGLGGGLGSLARYFLSTFFVSFNPWVTALINVGGGFLIGFLYRYTEDLSSAQSIRAFWMFGFCGGFTTFSAFGLDFFHLLKDEQLFLVLIYLVVSLIGTIIAVFWGMRSFSYFG